MNAPCPHHCPPGSGGGHGGPLAALIAVIVAVAVLAGPLSRAATAALSAAIDVLEITAITVSSAAALAALAALTVLARRIIRRHRRGVVTRATVIVQPAQAHTAHRAPLTARPHRALPARIRIWRPGDPPARSPAAGNHCAGQKVIAMTTWRTDDPCPVCGTGLHATGDGTPVLRQDCPLCGWSATWQPPEGR